MSKIKIMALGGLGENGKNMYVVEVDEHIFILDAGMKYPDIDLYGVDGIIPDLDYLKQNKNRIEGIFISHGHEDQIGALPYLLKNIPTRVYGTHFTISLVESLLTEHNMNIENFKLFRINANKVMKFGNVSVSFFNTTHSIPESIGIAISTEDGVIVYCTDFNFGAFSSNTYQTTFDKITDIGKTKVLALLSESISAGTIGRISNDSLLDYKFNNVLTHTKGRIIVGAYSTDLIRIQKIIDLATAAGKKIAIISKKSERIIEVSVNSNYLRIPEELKIQLNDITEDNNNEIDDLVVIVTGYRDEPYATLVRMALKEDSKIHFNENDKVVLMCPAVPGTEKAVTDAINVLYEYDTNLEIFDKSVLRSSHASPEDLKMLYTMLKPEYVIPIKGEFRHLYEQSIVLKEAGYDKDHVLMLENGDVVRFDNGVLQDELGKIEVGDIFIDGSNTGVVDINVVKEREVLCEEGVIYVYGAIDMRKRTLAKPCEFASKGFSSGFSDEELTNSLGELMDKMIKNALSKKSFNLDSLKESLSNELGKLVTRYTKHRPVVIPVIVEINA